MKYIVCEEVCGLLSWMLGHQILSLCYKLMSNYDTVEFFYGELQNTICYVGIFKCMTLGLKLGFYIVSYRVCRQKKLTLMSYIRPMNLQYHEDYIKYLCVRVMWHTYLCE
jgi:hypothetical protein